MCYFFASDVFSTLPTIHIWLQVISLVHILEAVLGGTHIGSDEMKKTVKE
jgi:hypothetical protein